MINKRALVISGGGAKGSFALGCINKNIKYDEYYGVSTGALIVSLLAIGKYDRLVDLYLNLKPEQIYKKNPFNKKGKLKITNLIYKLIRGEDSIADTSPLLDLIRKHYRPIDHQNLKSVIYVGVTNLMTGKFELKASNEYTWLEFTELIWSSTLAYPFTTVNGHLADGGFSSPLPIVPAVKNNSHIDCIILSTENRMEDFKSDNIINGVANVMNQLLTQLRIKDVNYANYLAKQNNIIINYIYTPFKLTNQSMNFNKFKMQQWFKIGQKYRIKN